LREGTTPLSQETQVLTFRLVLLSLAALLAIAFGIRYLLAKAFMPYHAVVAGKAWPELPAGLQTIILGTLRIVGGGLATYGVALLWLLLPLSRHETWAAWAVLTLTLTAVVPTLSVTISLRRFEPAARTPIVPAALVLGLALIGAGTAFVA
jgi:hypothetical protein